MAKSLKLEEKEKVKQLVQEKKKEIKQVKKRTLELDNLDNTDRTATWTRRRILEEKPLVLAAAPEKEETQPPIQPLRRKAMSKKSKATLSANIAHYPLSWPRLRQHLIRQ